MRFEKLQQIKLRALDRYKRLVLTACTYNHKANIDCFVLQPLREQASWSKDNDLFPE